MNLVTRAVTSLKSTYAEGSFPYLFNYLMPKAYLEKEFRITPTY